MANHRVYVRWELWDDDAGKRVTWDTQEHYFTADRADGGHPHVIAISGAIGETIERLAKGSPPIGGAK